MTAIRVPTTSVSPTLVGLSRKAIAAVVLAATIFSLSVIPVGEVTPEPVVEAVSFVTPDPLVDTVLLVTPNFIEDAFSVDRADAFWGRAYNIYQCARGAGTVIGLAYLFVTNPWLAAWVAAGGWKAVVAVHAWSGYSTWQIWNFATACRDALT
ncbi:MAG: hypothetical protein AAGD35_18950 [Actinomycetota bacterium]